MYTAARINNEKCISCKLCIICCPEPNVIMLDGEKKTIVHSNRCKGCGLCENICPKEAITVEVNSK
jgi:Pyruvate/2-oxoacid:ferredoxin oxidoreductase delta subunit